MKQQKMNTNKETGRSMVEMLGVLAVIGVLSIGGIAGYTMAMNKHRANELMDGASKRAIVVMQQLALGVDPGEVSLATEFTNNDTGAGVFGTGIVDVAGGEFGIQVSGVEKSVCETLANMAGGDMSIAKDSGTEVVDITASDCSAENNLLFVFDGSAGGASGGDDDDEGGVCSAYPGTSVDNEGGIAGLSDPEDEGSEICRCPANKLWYGGRCTGGYALGNNNAAHYNLVGNTGCPTGATWASSSDLINDFGCSQTSGNLYTCTASLPYSYGWLSDCLGTCETNSDALQAYSSSSLGPTIRHMMQPAICKYR